MYHLKIKNTDSGLEWEVNYPGSTLLEKVRYDYFLHCGIPNEYQVWSGWPSHLQNSNCINEAGVAESSIHILEVYDARKKRHASHPTLVQAPDAIFENNDVAVCQAGSAVAANSLTTQLYGADEIFFVESFVSNFSTKYRDLLPSLFFVGSLSSAVEKAWDCDPPQRRPLAIYVHRTNGDVSDRFCRQILCDPAAAQFLSENFVTWPWDLTQKELRPTLHQIFAFVFKFPATIEQLLTALSMDKLPKLLLLHRLTASVDVLGEIGSSCSLTEAMDALLAAHDLFVTDNAASIAAVVGREAREAERQALERAYLESLEHDMKKEKLRLKKFEHTLKRNDSSKDSNVPRSVDLPPEPTPNDVPSIDNEITTLRLRIPSFGSIARRFRADDRLRHLFAFLSSLGYPSTHFKVITSFPRRDLTQLSDMELTLRDLNMVPQETLILEEKD